MSLNACVQCERDECLYSMAEGSDGMGVGVYFCILICMDNDINNLDGNLRIEFLKSILHIYSKI